ncbi:hypothetical protein KGY64_01715 [Candidatus Bipolaricaulota bacterium]|nr:hypothetical protein [Candidatus Bipolaricaulota bacterium]
MFAIFSLILHLVGFVFSIIFGVVSLLFSLVFGVVKFSLLVPLVLVLAIAGLFFWHPLLWIGIAVMIYYLYRENKNKRYIKLRRHEN